MKDQKQLENMEYFNFLGSMIANDARCKHKIKSRLSRNNQQDATLY